MYSASVFFILKNKSKSSNIRVDLGLWCDVMCFGGRRVVLGHRDLSQGVFWGGWGLRVLVWVSFGLGWEGFWIWAWGFWGIFLRVVGGTGWVCRVMLWVFGVGGLR